ncbi:amino acid ABC transporter permease [Bordetella sp. LUAb4]|uniref:amino acid ABC transporter permease n=1 Tax=Bordetella sp. LUAb4 TaxID=2843195 RepID=UPI001E550384|nr:amino acid ABC transporter permease [Bordetella sp. LUAb4]
MHYNWNWSIFFEMAPDGSGSYLDTLWRGLGWTVSTALLAWVLALSLGAIIGVMRTTESKLAQRIGTCYVELFRNIPLLVQMFLWYFVLPELMPKALGDEIKQMAPPWAMFWPAVFCLGFFTSSRVAEQVRAGIGALPRGQRMAGTALGLRPAQVYRYVLLPMAFRIILPPLTSEFLNLIKNTSIAFTIGLLELTGSARSMQEFSFQVFEAFAGATILYFFLNMIVQILARLLERRVAVPGFMGTRVNTGGH